MKANTLEILKKAGWYEGRTFDTGYVTEELNKFDYPVLDAFKKFYEAFGDISFICEVEGYARKIEFYLEDIDENLHDIIQKKYTRITNCMVNPIGSIDETATLVIDENDTIYSLYDIEVTIIGKNTEEALDNLCNRPWGQWSPQETFPYPEWFYEDRRNIMKDMEWI